MTVARFLSPEWLDELNTAAARDHTVAGAVAGATLTLQQVVTGTAAGEVTYAVRIGDGRVTVTPGRADDADATITEDAETAAAISSGRLTSQTAILAGRVRVSGDLGALVEHQELLERLDHVFAEVRETTTY